MIEYINGNVIFYIKKIFFTLTGWVVPIRLPGSPDISAFAPIFANIASCVSNREHSILHPWPEMKTIALDKVTIRVEQ